MTYWLQAIILVYNYNPISPISSNHDIININQTNVNAVIDVPINSWILDAQDKCQYARKKAAAGLAPSKDF